MAIRMQTTIRNDLVILRGEFEFPPIKYIYPLTTSLVFALKDSLKGISTITASTG